MNTDSSPSAVIPFCFEAQNVRVIPQNGNPWFVAKDVCDILEIGNPTRAVSALDEDELTLLLVRSGGQEREMNVISESGLYTLIIRSNKPQAKPFRKWVTAEVLPSIRKTGGYNLTGGGEKKTVDVNHTHLRGTTAPGNLDIRYTLDLSKIIMKPSRTGIELLERLTGIALADVLPEQVEDGDLVERFLGECLVMVEGEDRDSRISLAETHRLFLSWHKERCGSRSPHSAKWLAAAMRRLGQTVAMRAGHTWLFGLKVRGVRI